MGETGESMQPVTAEETNGMLPVFKQVIDRMQGRPGFFYDFYDGYNAQVILEALRHPASASTQDVSGLLFNRPEE